MSSMNQPYPAETRSGCQDDVEPRNAGISSACPIDAPVRAETFHKNRRYGATCDLAVLEGITQR